jgi:putative phage-type endonuclease
MLTNEQIETRRNYLTASDVAAVMGCSPWKSAADVWHEKVYGVEKHETSDAIEAGTQLEDAIIDWFELKDGVFGDVLDRQCFYENGVLGATVDGILKQYDTEVEAWFPGAVVEAKTSSSRDGWGDPRTDQIPDQYMLQVQTQMYCTGLSKAYIPVLFADRGFKFEVYEVNEDEEIQDAIVNAANAFMEAVRNKTPVSGEVDLSVLKRLKREPNKSVEIDGNLLIEFKEAKDQVRRWSKKVDDLQARLLASLGDAEHGVCSIGEVTYLPQKRKGFTVKDTEFRVLRFKEEKNE